MKTITVQECRERAYTPLNVSESPWNLIERAVHFHFGLRIMKNSMKCTKNPIALHWVPRVFKTPEISVLTCAPADSPVTGERALPASPLTEHFSFPPQILRFSSSHSSSWLHPPLFLLQSLKRGSVTAPELSSSVIRVFAIKVHGAPCVCARAHKTHTFGSIIPPCADRWRVFLSLSLEKKGGKQCHSRRVSASVRAQVWVLECVRGSVRNNAPLFLRLYSGPRHYNTHNTHSCSRDHKVRHTLLPSRHLSNSPNAK